MNQEARKLYNTLKAQMPTQAAKNSFTSAMHNHSKGTGRPRPQHGTATSASTLSRFYNKDHWNTAMVTKALQIAVIGFILAAYKHCKGFAQVLQVCVDLTTLEKTGKFKNLPVCILNKVKGLHIIVLYVCLAGHRYPFSYAIWKGKGRASLSDLTIALLKQLQKALPKSFRLRLLGDTAFGTTRLLEACEKLGIHAVTGIPRDRKTNQGQRLEDLTTRGAEVKLHGCSVAVWVSWFKLYLHDGSFEWRYVVSTKKAHGLTIIKWGRARWGIEAFFKCMKSRFGLDQFGQRTLLGVTRFILLCFLAYSLVACSREERDQLPDWQALAAQVRRELMPMLNWLEVQLELALLQPILARDMQDYASTA
jgi:hypothetical protein